MLSSCVARSKAQQSCSTETCQRSQIDISASSINDNVEPGSSNCTSRRSCNNASTANNGAAYYPVAQQRRDQLQDHRHHHHHQVHSQHQAHSQLEQQQRQHQQPLCARSQQPFVGSDISAFTPPESVYQVRPIQQNVEGNVNPRIRGSGYLQTVQHSNEIPRSISSEASNDSLGLQVVDGHQQHRRNQKLTSSFEKLHTGHSLLVREQETVDENNNRQQPGFAAPINRDQEEHRRIRHQVHQQLQKIYGNKFQQFELQKSRRNGLNASVAHSNLRPKLQQPAFSKQAQAISEVRDTNEKLIGDDLTPRFGSVGISAGQADCLMIYGGKYHIDPDGIGAQYQLDRHHHRQHQNQPNQFQTKQELAHHSLPSPNSSGSIMEADHLRNIPSMTEDYYVIQPNAPFHNCNANLLNGTQGGALTSNNEIGITKTKNVVIDSNHSVDDESADLPEEKAAILDRKKQFESLHYATATAAALLNMTASAAAAFASVGGKQLAAEKLPSRKSTDQKPRPIPIRPEINPSEIAAIRLQQQKQQQQPVRHKQQPIAGFYSDNMYQHIQSDERKVQPSKGHRVSVVSHGLRQQQPGVPGDIAHLILRQQMAQKNGDIYSNALDNKAQFLQAARKSKLALPLLTNGYIGVNRPITMVTNQSQLKHSNNNFHDPYRQIYTSNLANQRKISAPLVTTMLENLVVESGRTRTQNPTGQLKQNELVNHRQQQLHYMTQQDYQLPFALFMRQQSRSHPQALKLSSDRLPGLAVLHRKGAAAALKLDIADRVKSLQQLANDNHTRQSQKQLVANTNQHYAMTCEPTKKAHSIAYGLFADDQLQSKQHLQAQQIYNPATNPFIPVQAITSTQSDMSSHSNGPLVSDVKSLTVIERICRIDLTMFWWFLTFVCLFSIATVIIISRHFIN